MKRAGYALSTDTVTAGVVKALVDALRRHPATDMIKLRIQTDHGSQYVGKEFNSTVKSLDLKHEYIWYKMSQ